MQNLICAIWLNICAHAECERFRKSDVREVIVPHRKNVFIIMSIASRTPVVLLILCQILEASDVYNRIKRHSHIQRYLHLLVIVICANTLVM